MANEKIHEYIKVRTAANSQADDVMDWDSTEDGGISWESAQMSRTEFLLLINNNITTIYLADSNIISNRILNAQTFDTTWQSGNVIVQSDELNDYGFIIKENGGAERAQLGFDITDQSGFLTIHDGVQQFFKAQEGRVEIGNPTLSTAKVHIKADDEVPAFRIDGDNLTKMFQVEEISEFNIFVSVANATRTGAEEFGVNGDCRTTAGWGMLGANASPNVAVTIPVDKNVVNIAGVNVMSHTAADGLQFRSQSVPKISFEVDTNQFMIMERPVGTLGEFSLMSDAATAISTIEEIDLSLKSQYWDGAATQIKKGTIHHNITAAPAGTSQLDFNIAGTTILVIHDDGVVEFKSFTVATLPTVLAGGCIRVSDETGGDTLAYSNGVNWLRMSDGAVVS